jgi:hypothetical protein
VTIFDFDRPFLGLSVTVTLHDPALKVFKRVPDTLQNFEMDIQRQLDEES